MLSALFIVVAVAAADRAWALRGDKRWFWAASAVAAGSIVAAAASLPNLLYLQKVLALLVMPIGLVWCGLFAGFLACRVRQSPRAATGFLAAFLALGISANPWLGRTLLSRLEAPYRDIDPLVEAPFDVVFVLGGGTSLDGHGNPILGSSGDRVMLGARLWHRGIAKHLVPSGSSIAGIGKSRDVGAETESIWMSVGLPDEAITPLPDPRNTSEEIAAYEAMIAQKGWERVGIVTSAWHMRRAMRLASRHGLQVEPLPADFRGSTSFDGLISLIPTGFGARDVHRASWEYLGAAVGR